MKFLINVPNLNSNTLKRHNIKCLEEQLKERDIDYKIIKGTICNIPDLNEYDAIINKTGTFLLAYTKAMDKIKHRVFNTAEATLLCRDKLKCYKQLEGIVKQPKTSVNQIDIGFPCVVKDRTGSFGKKVDLVSTRDELNNLIKTKYKNNKLNLIYQEVIPTDKTSIRLVYIGNKFIGACKFTAKENNFQSNLGSGGSAEKYEPSQDILTICNRAQQALGTDYVGFDVLINNETGEPVFLEANSNAWTSGFDRVQGINTTKLFVDYIEEQLKIRQKTDSN